MTATVRVERCKHDMEILPGGVHTCSICRGGLPYEVPSIDDEIRIADSLDEAPRGRLWWLPAEARTECASCGGRINEGQLAAWSPQCDGPIGKCCGDES